MHQHYYLLRYLLKDTEHFFLSVPLGCLAMKAHRWAFCIFEEW